MRFKHILLFLFFTFTTQHAISQSFDKEEQYKQALQNAKLAFNAKQYSQAVVFYREALKIKPKALLPQYKIEDIRTIYIKKEIDLLKTANKPKDKPKKTKRKKQKKAEQEAINKQVEATATKKMNQDAEKVMKEMYELKTVAEVLNIDDEPDIDTENIEVQDIEPDRETAMKEIKTKNSKPIKYETDKQQITAKTKEIKKEETIKKPVEKPEKKQKKTVKKATKPKIVKKTTKKPTKDWIEKENNRLAKIYPNKKTIEEIDKPQKHITRVIMNINGKVTTYLKVKHSWGATFYFVDEVGLDLSSISQNFFFRMTNLDTYKD